MATVALNPFIVSTDVRKVDPKTRRQIRSHVMLGKNRGKRRTTKQIPSDDEQNGGKTPVSQPLVECVPPKIPSRVGSECSGSPFIIDIEPRLVSELLRCRSTLGYEHDSDTTIANSNVVTHMAKELSPLSRQIAFKAKHEKWLVSLTLDAVYCHAFAFATQVALGRHLDAQTSRHFGQALKLLRQRLEGNDIAVQTCDTTLMSIMILATSALLTGHTGAARDHLSGARKIIALRGGIKSLNGSLKLLLEILRCDIGVALSTGWLPLFSKDPATGAPWPLLKLATLPYERLEDLLPAIDARLTIVWRTLKNFCRIVNEATQSTARLPEQIFFDNTASSMYPLLSLRFGSGSMDEVVRLATLSFCSSTFLQWPDMGYVYTWLPAAHKVALEEIRGIDGLSPAVHLWLLSIAAVSGLNGVSERAWLFPRIKSTMRKCGLTSWDDVRESLGRFLWIDFVHDRRMEAVYSAAMAPNDHDGSPD